MRRVTVFLAAVLLLALMCMPASAATSISDAQIDVSLNTDGSCSVHFFANLTLDQVGDVRFPVPGNATGITLNGTGAFTTRSGGYRYVDLSSVARNATGVFPINLYYTIPHAVSYNEAGKPQLDLPLLCGFTYPISSLAFTLTLPDKVQATPVFVSGYHDQSIKVEWEASERQIAGFVSTSLKDNETLSMTLELDKKTFPRSKVDPWSGGVDNLIAYVLMGLTALYWLIFLRCAPHIRKRTLLPPDGATAGELRCVLTGQGADLTMMVMTWAQLGYILLHVKENGTVTLYKRMEMGNERGSFENKIFRSLFSGKRSVDGSGYHYARLYRQVAASRGSLSDLFRRQSGNPRFLRYLGVAAGLFGGASLAIALAGNATLAILIIFFMSIVGGVASWLIQGWVDGLHLRNRGALILGLAVGTVWIILGFIGGEPGMAIGMVAFQLAVGLAGAYGGRRTMSGRAATAQTLGLRANLKKLPAEDLARIRRTEPDYFFTMAPYALALGVDKAFARQFGRLRLNPCPWLTTGMDGHMTALEWSREMRRAAASLDEHQKRLPWERLMGR